MSEQDLLLELDAAMSETNRLKRQIGELSGQLETNLTKLLNFEKINYSISNDLSESQKKVSELFRK